MIPSQNYFSPDIFEIEKIKYFSKNFNLGTSVGLSSKNDYRTFNQFFYPITVRNCGDIRIFKNICLHRSSLIDIDEIGNSPFACKYHGWAYSDSGDLIRTPLDSSIKLCNRKLEEVESDVIDKFIFINPTPDFKKKFSEIKFLHSVEMSSCFFNGSLMHNCNWKLLVENVLEPYHISFVHKDSFVPIGLSSTSPYEWQDTDLGSYNRVESRASSEKYYSHLDFPPNLFISDTNGYVTFVSYFIPINVDQTLLFYEMWESPRLFKRPSYVKNIIRGESIEFTKKVLLEDKEIVEAAQIGLRHAKKEHLLSLSLEPRIFKFHENYMRVMG
jgi:phenylpropionate dioxygenase-like ring-hydroxylating dioxygenase large terminal subunit